jgi:hypothetical protein
MQQTSSQTTLVDRNTMYNNVCLVIKTSEQSYLSVAAWCGDTGLITVGCGEQQWKEAESCCIERARESDYIHNQDE